MALAIGAGLTPMAASTDTLIPKAETDTKFADADAIDDPATLHDAEDTPVPPMGPEPQSTVAEIEVPVMAIGNNIARTNFIEPSYLALLKRGGCMAEF